MILNLLNDLLDALAIRLANGRRDRRASRRRFSH
jgi:hypothetical protein